MVAAKIANLGQHTNQFTKVTSIDVTISQPDAAKLMNVGVATVQRARAVVAIRAR